MTDITVAELAGLNGKDYVTVLKDRMRNDDTWLLMLHPTIINRTRYTLARMIESIDEQKARIQADGSAVDGRWQSSINSLRRHCVARLAELPAPSAPVALASNNKESRAWRAFSAQLARVLDEHDPSALDNLTAPYGGLTARQWLESREAKA